MPFPPPTSPAPIIAAEHFFNLSIFFSSRKLFVSLSQTSFPVLRNIKILFIFYFGANVELYVYIFFVTGKAKTKEARQTIINPDWNFEKMGIGGLDKEFSDIFRRAFASRVFPPDIVEQMGEGHTMLVMLGPLFFLSLMLLYISMLASEISL